MKLKRALTGVSILTLIGLGVSIYLTYVYTVGATPVCLGAGGCAEVEHSRYAWIAGLPVPAYGVLLYAVLLGLALWIRRQEEPPEWPVLALFGGALAGTLFSVYLTYMELFVIRAVCYWCVASAIIILLTFLLSVAVWRRYQADAA